MRATILLGFSLLAAASIAPASPFFTGRVTDSADGAATAAGLRLEAWAGTIAGAPCPEAQVLGSVRSDGYLFDQQLFAPLLFLYLARVETSVPDPLGPFGESGYFASRTIPGLGTGGANATLPAMSLVRIPQPVATTHPDGALLTWAHAMDCGEPVDDARGVDGYAVLRSPAGADTFTEIGRVAADAATLEFIDDTVPAGTWDYVLKLVLPTYNCAPGQVLGSGFSRKATILVTRDRDADGIQDSVDNCPDTPNASQDDVDADGRGDACEPEQPIILVRKVASGLRIDIGPISAPPLSLHDLHAHDLPLVAGDSATFRDTARTWVDCDISLGSSFVEFTEPARRRFYLVSVVLPDGGYDLGNESSGAARPLTTTLPGCR